MVVGKKVALEVMEELSVEEVQEGEDLAEDGKFHVMFSKGMINSDPGILKYSSIKELVYYVGNKDAKVEEVKVLIIKANRELRLRGKRLYIRKAFDHDKEADNRICITSR